MIARPQFAGSASRASPALGNLDFTRILTLRLPVSSGIFRKLQCRGRCRCTVSCRPARTPGKRCPRRARDPARSASRRGGLPPRPRARRSGAVERRRERLAVGSERQGRDDLLGPAEREPLGLGGHVPESNGPISPAAASVLPSGEKATDQTARACPFSLARGHPPATSHSVTTPSPPAVAIVYRRGKRRSIGSRRTTPFSVRTAGSTPNPNIVSTGPPAVARDRPSGVKARALGSPVSTASRSSSRLVAVSQSCKASELEPTGSVASILPSGENARRISGRVELERIASLLAAPGIPELDGAVSRRRRRGSCRRRDQCQRPDLGLDARERLGRELRVHVPELELAVGSSGGQRLTVGGQGKSCHRSAVSLRDGGPGSGGPPCPSGGASRRPRR